MHVFYYLNKSNVPLQRKSKDCRTNAYGQQLLKFCKSYDLLILNGRIGVDAVYPKLLWKDHSMIHYFILRAQFMENIDAFCVNDFSPFFSDAHCGNSLTIKL